MNESTYLLLTKNSDYVSQSIRKWATKVDKKTTNMVDFFIKHPDLPIPDSILSNSKCKININYHSEEFNNMTHCHDFYEVVYVAKGTVQDKIGNEIVTLHTNEALIHCPKVKHTIVSFSDENDFLINFFISKTVLKNTFFSYLLSDPGLASFFFENDYIKKEYLLFSDLSETTEQVIELLIKEFCENKENNLIVESLLLLLFAELIKGKNTEVQSFSEKILDYISSHIDTVSLESISNHFNYHPKYFSALVKKEMGKSFQEVLTTQRLNQARLLLAYSDKTIDEISYTIGYKDQTSLFINFKKEFGITPKEYRMKMMKN